MNWKTKDHFNWHRWFAWHPVSNGKTTFWLEFIERQLVDDGSGVAYRKAK